MFSLDSEVSQHGYSLVSGDRQLNDIIELLFLTSISR